MRRIFAVVATGALALGACGEMEIDDTSTTDESVVSPTAIADAVVTAADLHEMPSLERGRVELARFVGYADPVNGTMEIQRVFETAEGRHLRTVGQANWCDAVVEQDGVTGSNPDDTVELYTVDGSIGSALPGEAVPAECTDTGLAADRPAYDDLYGINGVFCATVGIGNFYDAELLDVTAEITYTGDAEHAPTQYPYGNAANPDDATGVNRPTAADGGMFPFGDLAVAGGVNDTAEALWTFNNGSNAPFLFEGRIVYNATEICGNDIDDDCDGVVDNDCREFDDGDACVESRDCLSGLCPDDVCVAASCDDGVTNGDEQGVDCGGSCPETCLTEWSGIRQNVDQSTLVGWEECYVDTYNRTVPLSTVFSGCDGDNLMMACRPTGSTTLRVAAYADRAAMTGTDDGRNNTGRLLNGVRWYYSNSYSWGFFPDGQGVSRNSCDTNSTGNNDRICWHTGGSSLNGGWRCGNQTSLNGSTGYERVLMDSNGSGGSTTCFDGLENGDEDGVDCGGALCPVCAPATCDDGVENGDELGVDCGGPLCDPCACDDGVRNGDETGVDCGGTYCDECDVLTFSGIRQNLPVADLTGWTECYRSTFGQSGLNLASGLLAACDEANLLMGCRPVGASALTLAAHGPRAAIFGTDDGTNRSAGRSINGAAWYYSPSWSMGFFQIGDGVSRNSCDTASGSAPQLRMCVHTSGGNMNSGYRCGNTFLNGNNSWERVYYEAP